MKRVRRHYRPAGTPSDSPFALTRQGGEQTLPHAAANHNTAATTARPYSDPSPWSEARRGSARQGGRVSTVDHLFKRIATLFALLLPLLAAASAIEPLPFESETERDRFRSLVEELRCTVCQNQSLADSDAPLARDLRKEIFTQIRAGRSDAEIRDFMVARYGEFILYNPPLAAHTLVLWAGPGVLLGIGIIVAIVTVRRRRQRLDAE